MIYSYKVNNLPTYVPLGYIGEKNYRQIDIDISEWIEEMPNGVPSIVHMRPGETETEAYVAATTYSDGVIHWIITAGDLGAVEGTGSAQVLLEEEENDSVVKRGKSAIFATLIKDSIGEPTRTVPSGVQTILDQMTVLKNAAVAAYNGIMEADMNYPIISEETGNWMLWDPLTDQWVDSGQTASGVPGPQGEKGDQGETGPQGDIGPQGPQGVKGDTGEKGDTGDTGPTGATGAAGKDGKDGKDGADGADGVDGEDGFSPVVTVTTISGGHTVTITDAEGDTSFNVMDGADGEDGQDGTDGQDGVSPTVSTATITGGHSVTITDGTGDHTFNVMDGEDGATGQTGPAGPGVASGGTAGQVLKKSSSTDYATEWDDPIEFEGGTFDYDDIQTFTAGHDGIVNWLKAKIEPGQSGTGDPSPSNVRAISGWTEARIAATGKNLYDDRLLLPYKQSDGSYAGTVKELSDYSIINFTDAFRSYYSGQTLTFSFNVTSNPDGRRIIAAYNDGSYHNGTETSSTGSCSVSFEVTSSIQFIRIRFVSGNSSSLTIKNIQLEVGSSVTAFEPFVGYTISFPASAGTVYGGNLTVNADGTGKLVVTKEYVLLDGSDDEIWVRNTGTYNYFYCEVSNYVDKYVNAEGISDHFTCTAISVNSDSIGFSVTNKHQIRVRYAVDNNLTVSNLRSWLSSNPSTFILNYLDEYKKTYDLSAPQIATLLGLNNLWCDTGDCSFQYSESVDQGDTTTVVTTGEKANWNNALNRLTDILDMLAFREAGFTATETHQQDTVIVVGTELYRTTAAIPAGNAIIPGTNCTKTTIIDEIVRLTT